MLNPACFADHMLNVAAGTIVDGCAYKKWETRLNIMKVKALGKAFRDGWLHNLMARITPLTVRDDDDYLMMADLFVVDATAAQQMLYQMSADMSAFATAAGLPFSPHSVPMEMEAHMRLYNRIAQLLAAKFEFEAPLPFASTTVNAEVQAQMPFIREFMAARRAA